MTRHILSEHSTYNIENWGTEGHVLEVAVCKFCDRTVDCLSGVDGDEMCQCPWNQPSHSHDYRRFDAVLARFIRQLTDAKIEIARMKKERDG